MHGLNRILHHFPGFFRTGTGTGDQRTDFLGPVGGIADGRGDLLERSGRFFDGCRLLFGSACEVVGRRTDFTRTRVDRAGIRADCAKRVVQLGDRVVEVFPEAIQAIGKGTADPIGEIAVGQPSETRCQRIDRMLNLGCVGGLLRLALEALALLKRPV